MDQQSPTTPSATPFKESKTQASSYESCSPILISSQISGSDEFKPHQMLMQTPTTIECGQDLSTKLIVHEELICCHSRLLEERFAKAKALRQKYEQANTLRSQMAAHVFPEVTEHEFGNQNHQEKALPLIIFAYEKYPLTIYHEAVMQCITKATEKQVKAKKVKAQMLQTAIREEDWKRRITYINPPGVHAITAELFGMLHLINKKEITRAEEDVVRAAAQKRILVPDVEEGAVLSVMQWIYEGKSGYQDPQQLCNTLQLATQLGIEALSELCLTKLCNAAQDSMHKAMITGKTLKHLLGFGSDSIDNVIDVIFKHALQDHDTPKRIQELVVDAMAKGLDLELWSCLKDTVSHNIALQVIAAMLENRQQVLEGSHDHDVIKYEDERAHIAFPIQHEDK